MQRASQTLGGTLPLSSVHREVNNLRLNPSCARRDSGYLVNAVRAVDHVDHEVARGRTRSVRQNIGDLSVGDLMRSDFCGRLYFERYMKVHRQASVKEEHYRMNRLCRTVVPRPNARPLLFGSWTASSITAGDLDAYRDIVLSTSRGTRCGIVSVNRCLGLLRAMFNWAILKGYVERTPFKVGSVTAVRMLKETPRHRRLEPGEEERLLAEASPHLWALIIAAVETCCRQGELLSLQWRQVKWERNELHFPPDKTKARRERFIPISQRLRALLDMRRHGPDGRAFGPDAYVFGNEIGERVRAVKTAWKATCRRAGIDDLNFHDLRREAGHDSSKEVCPNTTSNASWTTPTSPPRRGISPRHGVGCTKCSGCTSNVRRRKLGKVASSLQERRDLPYL